MQFGRDRQRQGESNGDATLLNDGMIDVADPLRDVGLGSLLQVARFAPYLLQRRPKIGSHVRELIDETGVVTARDIDNGAVRLAFVDHERGARIEHWLHWSALARPTGFLFVIFFFVSFCFSKNE